MAVLQLGLLQIMYRVYYNRAADAPQVWSVDQGSHSSEINVQGIKLHEVCITSHYSPKAEYPEPKAWFQLEHVRLELRDGVAHFYPL